MSEENITNLTSSDNVTYALDCDDHQGVVFQVVVYTMYFLISSVATIGNGIICYIIVGSSRMRTVTNYFIMNLAVGDLLIAVLCAPFTAVSYVKQRWPFGAALCPVIAYFQAIAIFVSSYTLVAISLDRYVAIMWPLRPRMSKKYASAIIFAVWGVACLGGGPVFLFSKLNQPTVAYEACDWYICAEEWPIKNGDYWYSQGLTLFQYAMPVSVFIFAYTSIATVIWCHRIPGEAENCRDQRIARSKRKMIKMMITVVSVYTICYLPYNVFWIVNAQIESATLKKTLFFAFHGLAVSHTCYNPIIYCYMNSRFRAGIMSALPCCRKCIASLLTNRTRSSTSLPLTSLEGTETTLLNRDNTYTTYVSMRRQNGSRIAKSHNQAPVRSASMMRPTSGSQVSSYTKSVRYPKVLENRI